MPASRRQFISGVSSASALALSGFAGELLCNAFESPRPALSPARILFNENPLGPSPKALDALRNAGGQFSRYPLGQGPELAMQLRRINGLPYNALSGELSLAPAATPQGSHDLILGVGSSEILRAAAWAYCFAGGNVVEAHPSYSAIGAVAAQIPGVHVERKLVPLDAGNRIDVPGMIAAIDKHTKIVVICNPNNPTGTDLTLAEIESITAATPADALVFIDEAYIEFLENYASASAVEFCLTKKNVLVARTFSKIYGLAGLRIGYGISSNEVIGRLNVHMLGGLSLNMPGVLAATAALDDQDHIRTTLQLTHQIHETWARSFNGFGWKMTPTKTSFCWVDLGFDCTPLVRFLSERGVLISGGQRWNLANCVRISTGTLEENDRLLHAAKAFVSA